MSLNHKNILITYGPTWVPIDDTRVISNRSSGAMGKLITAELLSKGARVTVLQGPITAPLTPSAGLKVINYQFYDELDALLQTTLSAKPDIVIHAAAVSDYRPQKKSSVKISSSRKSWQIKLVPTPKLIRNVKRLAPDCILVGFKLESTRQDRRLKQAAGELLQKGRCDLVLANSLKNGYYGILVDHNGKILDSARQRKTIARKLTNILTTKINKQK
ncbi:MAG: phosphopantothenoylcysteine decarboxylase [Candidatus Omnitrophota bacterium]